MKDSPGPNQAGAFNFARGRSTLPLRFGGTETGNPEGSPTQPCQNGRDQWHRDTSRP
jgi:hypothetical protein